MTTSTRRKNKSGSSRNKKKQQAKAGKPLLDDPAPLHLHQLAGKENPLLWRLPHELLNSSLKDRIARLYAAGKRPKKHGLQETDAAEWLEKASHEPPTLELIWEAIGWAWALRSLVDTFDEVLWRRVFDHLVSLAGSFPAALLEEPLLHQWQNAELPLTLCRLFPSEPSCAKLGEAATDAMSQGLLDLLDGEGMLASRYWNRMGPLLATWTRMALIAEDTDLQCFRGDSLMHYQWLVRQTIRVTRGDGGQVLSPVGEAPYSPGLMQAAISFGGDDDDLEIAATALPGNRKTKYSAAALPSPGDHSEWAAATVLRSDWSRKARGCAVCWGGDTTQAEIWSGKRVLFQGEWSYSLTANGQAIVAESDWEEVCWHADDEIQYLELELPLQDGFRIQRQVVLAPEDGFLLLADAVLSDKPADLTYTSTLAPAADLQIEPAKDNHEAMLIADKHLGAMLPLAMPEWRSEASTSRWEHSAEGLVYQHQTNSNALYAPLFFDLKPKRARKDLTWRRLTIAQGLNILGANSAVGYRIRVGDDQWVLYRSLSGLANRTLMGQNLVCEFAAIRFDTEGDTDLLVQIE